MLRLSKKVCCPLCGAVLCKGRFFSLQFDPGCLFLLLFLLRERVACWYEENYFLEHRDNQIKLPKFACE